MPGMRGHADEKRQSEATAATATEDQLIDHVASYLKPAFNAGPRALANTIVRLYREDDTGDMLRAYVTEHAQNFFTVSPSADLPFIIHTDFC